MSTGAACHVLVVDDDRELRALVGKYLGEHGFRVTQAANGREMVKAIEVGRFDLVVLDLMMPGDSGLVLCQKLREQNGPPVIMLTAMGSEVDRVIGLEIGADDYVVKPFSPRELVLRIRAIFRRRGSTRDKDDSERIRVGELILDCSRHEVKAANRLVECTATEFKLLRILMERHGRVQGRDRLLSDVWGYDSVIDTRTVDTHMRRLRDKLGDCARYIETVRGFGYRLAIPAR